MKQSNTSSSSTAQNDACGCSSTTASPAIHTGASCFGGFQFANMASFGMGGCGSYSDTNALLQSLSEAQKLSETGQVKAYNEEYSQKIGGYPKTSLVSDPNDPSRFFISTKDDNTTDPTTDTSGAWFALTDTSIAARDAVIKEEQRAKDAEAALQPKGDYATNDGLNAETNRAKSVEETLQPKGNYATQSDLSAEAQRAQNAEASLQPKGDYATNDGLNAETNRAKSVEETLQPKGDYATQSDLSAEAQRAQNAEATLQPKGDYATNDGLNAETNRAKSVEETLQPKGDYATQSDLSGEAQRAQNAEATLQPKGDYATNDGLNAETNRAKSVEETLQPKGDYATQSDLSAEAQRAQNAEAALQPKGDYATNDGLNAETNRAKSVEETLQPKGDYATQSDLSAEAQRAQNAEATLQPKGDYATSSVTNTLEQNKVNRSGDTMTGDLTITQNGQWGDYKFGGKIISAVKGHSENAFLQSQFISGNPVAAIGVQSSDEHWHVWYFDISDESVRAPSGNKLLETGNTEGRRMRQSFRTSAKNGDRITWPKSYAKDDLVIVHFTATDSGNGQLHLVNILANTQADRSGCYVAIETVAKDTKDKLYSLPDAITLDVTVEGWAA